MPQTNNSDKKQLNCEDRYSKWLREVNPVLSPKNWNLFSTTEEYLVHVVVVDPAKAQAIREWLKPLDKRQLRSPMELKT